MTKKPRSPVRATGEITVRATPVAVWGLLSDIDQWPSWNPDVKSAHLVGQLRPGSKFTWKAGPGTIRSELADVEEPSVLAWTGTTLGIRAHHSWKLEQIETGTRILTDETWSGLLPRLFRTSMTRTLQKAIDNGLKSIREAVEKQA
ncbi:MAG: SRPBCC family protein [Acidimicrobiia bacterium]|nr:SRPBCC family protein [Acidimicrobiia bacterium]